MNPYDPPELDEQRRKSPVKNTAGRLVVLLFVAIVVIIVAPMLLPVFSVAR